MNHEMYTLPSGRLTPHRQAVLDLVRDRPSHLTAAQIYEAVHLAQPRIAFATVYNALHHLVQTGLIAEIRQPDGVVAYDRETTPHDHIICLRCGRLDDVPTLPGPSFDTSSYEEVAARTGYAVGGHRTVYAGPCPGCWSARDAQILLRRMRLADRDWTLPSVINP